MKDSVRHIYKYGLVFSEHVRFFASRGIFQGNKCSRAWSAGSLSGQLIDPFRSVAQNGNPPKK